jgi:hypothetical protein
LAPGNTNAVPPTEQKVELEQRKSAMKKKRSHPYKISRDEAKKAFEILSGPGPLVGRLKDLLEIKTGKSGQHRIGQGFRNDIQRIIEAAG